MTFIDLKTRVNRRVIDLPPAVSAEVPKLINEAIRSAQRAYNYRAMEMVNSYTTASGVSLLGTISNFKEFMDRGAYLFNQFRKADFIQFASDADMKSDLTFNPAYPGRPKFIISSLDLALRTTTLTLAPYPNTNSDWLDGNYIIKVPFYSYTPDLVNDGDTNWFTEAADDYIVYQATGEALGLNWDYNGMAIWLQKADTKLKEIKKADKMQRLGGVQTLVPHWQGANEPQVRR